MAYDSTAIQSPWYASAELVAQGGSSAQPIDFYVGQLLGGPCSWMVVNVVAREFFRDTTAGMRVPDITAFAQAPRRSSLWLRLSWWIGGSSQQIALDLAGGGRYALWGERCEAHVIAPPGSQAFGPGSTEQAIVGSRIGFTSVAVALERATGPYGDRHGRISQRVRVAAGRTGASTSIPPCATQLQIFEGGTPSNAPWRWVAGAGDDISGPPPVQYGPVNLASGASDLVSVPGFAQGLTMVGSAGADRDYAFVYRVDW